MSASTKRLWIFFSRSESGVSVFILRNLSAKYIKDKHSYRPCKPHNRKSYKYIDDSWFRLLECFFVSVSYEYAKSCIDNIKYCDNRDKGKSIAHNYLHILRQASLCFDIVDTLTNLWNSSIKSTIIALTITYTAIISSKNCVCLS